MKYKITYMPFALDNLQEIEEYITYNFYSPAVGKRLIHKIRTRISALRDNPHMYRAYEDEPYKSRGIRYFPVDNYIVYYRVDDQAQTVYILKISHGMQSPDTQLHGI